MIASVYVRSPGDRIGCYNPPLSPWTHFPQHFPEWARPREIEIEVPARCQPIVWA